jgi:lipase
MTALPSDNPRRDWHHRRVNSDHHLHVHRYGPDGPVQLLAVHGLTGHGARWRNLAGYLPEITFAAPDLIGHGRSSWAAPWTIEANVAALAVLLERSAAGPVAVVGHSFGGAIALHLAAARPDLVDALVLLDPAIGLDGDWMAEIAAAMLASPDYPDPGQARAEKEHGAWSDVDPALLDIELDEHLVALPEGRFGWRISVPAMMSYWSELARPPVLPGATATTLVRATRTSPAYVGDARVDALRARRGTDFHLADLDGDHMVAQARPVEVAAVVRQQLARR